MKRSSLVWMIGIVLLAALAGVAVIVLLNDYAKIRDLRTLTICPTPETEPQNRASYYLAAALLVVPPSPQWAENVLKLDLTDSDWSPIEPAIRELVRGNQQAIDLVRKTKDIPDCRMPLMRGKTLGDKSEFDMDDSLYALGEVLFWASYVSLRDGKPEDACDLAVLNLRMARDVALTGSFHQSSAGLTLYAHATRSLALAITTQPLHPQTLDLLEQRLPDCLFPKDFGEDEVVREHCKWSRLANFDHSPIRVRLLRALHTEKVPFLPRGAILSEPGLVYGDLGSTDPAKDKTWLIAGPGRNFDSAEGLNSGIALLQAGIAVHRYAQATGRLPGSMSDIVPKYVKQPPTNPAGNPVTGNATGEYFELSLPEIAQLAAPRTLRFDARICPAAR